MKSSAPTARERERIYRALNRLRRKGNQHPTDHDVSMESAIEVEKIRHLRTRVQEQLQGTEK